MKRIFEKLDRYFCGKWRLAVLDLLIGRWIVQPKASNIAYLKAQNANRRHILIQPDPTLAPYYLMIDDLPWHLVTRQHQLNRERWKPGRMIVETSRENYQVWVHSFRPLSLEEKRHWLKRLNSDPGTDPNNRWGRCPGFRNRKSKYRDTTGGYPLSKLLWIDWGCQADVPCRLIHSPGKASRSPSTQSPVWRGAQDRNIARSDYARGDESATDFAYAMALLRRRFSAEYVRDSLLSERKTWHNHTGEKRIQDYLDRTIERARTMLVRS